MYGALSKTISLFLAGVLSVVILIVPTTLTTSDNSVNHSILMLVLFGIMLGFIHGIGFKPLTRLYRAILHPLLAWLIMIPSLVLIVYKSGIL
jgi:predicted membrane protein